MLDPKLLLKHQTGNRTPPGPGGHPRHEGHPPHGLAANWRRDVHGRGSLKHPLAPGPRRGPSLRTARAPRIQLPTCRPEAQCPREGRSAHAHPGAPLRTCCPERLEPAVSSGGGGRPALRCGRKADVAFSVSAGRPAPIRAARCGGRCFPRRTWGNSAAVTTGTSPNARPGKLPGGFPRPRGRRCAGHGLSEGAAAATGLRARSGRPGSLAGFLTAPTCVPSEGTGGNAGSPSRVFLLLETEMTLCVSDIETFFFFAWLVVFITRVDSATGEIKEKTRNIRQEFSSCGNKADVHSIPHSQQEGDTVRITWIWLP
ncbi:translation initiation factor IF-2-like [Ursus americanus]|uniref:translation initiation factor IF-2-like n=1 Tax=Ursus americanus TaxID=9643 RepID=UPI001E67B693|nr:translation initiation factor IF-2-like [Ursus americanus]